MKSLYFFILLIIFENVLGLEFREQLKGLLPVQLEKFYHQIDRDDLIIIDHAFMENPDNFYAQIKFLMQASSKKNLRNKEFTTSNQKLAKKYAIAFTDIYKKADSFGKPLRFFYFWRVIHVLDDLLIYKATESNLNKFAADVFAEWNMLSIDDRKNFKSVFPKIVQRIEGHEFQEFASIGRKMWSFERFVVPKD